MQQYEALLKPENCSDEAERRAMMVSRAMYYSARMEAVCVVENRPSQYQSFATQAWKEGNYTVAEFMLRKITGISFLRYETNNNEPLELDDNHHIGTLPPHFVCPFSR